MDETWMRILIHTTQNTLDSRLFINGAGDTLTATTVAGSGKAVQDPIGDLGGGDFLVLMR